jgi:long-chain acyl-CoA synthetase
MLFDLLSRSAARHARRTALIAEDGTHLSYGALHAAATAFSSTLAESGVTAGDHVIVLLPNTLELVVATFAVARIGAVLVPLNPAFRSAELRYYFRECHAAAVITDSDHVAVCERVQRSLRQPPRIFTAVDGTAGTDGYAWPPVAPEAPALCQYSSGSTGLPKAIVRSHAQLCAEAEHFVTTVGVDPGERILTVVPLFHAHGFGNCLLAGIRAGATLVLRTAFHRRRTIATLIEEKVSLFPGVPFMFGILASSTSIARQPFPQLRLAFSAGAALPHDVFDGFQEKFGVAVCHLVTHVPLRLEHAKLGAYGRVARLAGQLSHHLRGGCSSAAEEDVHDLAFPPR